MRALTTLILQFLIKAWNFQNFIIFVTRNDFLTEALCTVTWVLTSAFFRLQNVFLQTMSTYISLEPQFNADQSFHGNYGLKMYDFQVTEGQSLPWHRHFSEEYFWVFLTYINLHTVGTAIYCWAKFPWEPWSKSVWFSRYKGSDQWWRHHISNGCS